MTKRRAFLLSAAGAAMLGSSGLLLAQAPKRSYRVAYVTSGVLPNPWTSALQRRFSQLGYVEGKNFVFDSRALDGDWTKAAEVARGLMGARPDVAIAAGSEYVLNAFRHAAGATPIVMIAVDFDPVERKHIASLARPGGNITGVYFRQVETAAKRLELLKAALPAATLVCVLFDTATRDQFDAAAQAATRLGIHLMPQQLQGARYDIEGAVEAAAAAKTHAILVLSSGAFFPSRERWLAAARLHRLPVVANPNYANAGALVSYGASFPHMYERAAEYVERIFRGGQPSDMPVEQPTQYELVVNLKSAKALGIAVPQAVLLRATRVIE